MNGTITISTEQWYEYQNLQAQAERERLAVQLIRRRQQLHWIVGNAPDPARMTIPELEAALAQLDRNEAAGRAYDARMRQEQGA